MAEKLKRSFKKHNYVELAVVNADNMIIAGHQRIRTMKAIGWDDKEIEVRVPNRLLDQQDVDDYCLASNKVSGDFDDDLLTSHFSDDFLKEIGWTDDELGLCGDDEEVEGIDPEEKLAIEVTCATEQEQRTLYEELQERGLTCRLLTL